MKAMNRLLTPFRGGCNGGYGNILIVIGVAGASLLLGRELVNRGMRMNANVKNEISNRDARLVSQRMLAAAGFMISNNLVVCREQGFNRGKNLCRWGDSKVFSLESLGLGEPLYSDRAVRFPLSPNSRVLSENKNLKILDASLDFTLVDARKDGNLERFIGDRPEELEMIDRDYSFIKAVANLEYEGGRGKEEHAILSYFRRPISIVTTLVKSDPVCTSRCSSSISQNPFPSCRGKQEIDKAAKVDILVRTTNNGPGVLYDLTYKKQVCFFKNRGRSCSPDPAMSKSIDVPITNALAVGSSVEWTDTVPCKKFVEQTSNPSKGNVPQHVTNVGRIEYILDAQDKSSSIEPFRMNYKVQKSGDNFPGIKNLIYIAPPH